MWLGGNYDEPNLGGRSVWPMTKTIYLHVGLPKTGTTTIQQYLRDNEAALRSVGYLYPGAKEVPELGSGRNHPYMMNAVMGRTPLPDHGASLNECREFVGRTQQIFRETPALHGLIWSYEGMAMSSRRWDRTYLAKLLDEFEVTIVVFIRYIDVWIESHYREMIWARAAPASQKTSHLFSQPLRKISDVSDDDEDENRPSAVEHGMSVSRALYTMREKLPKATIRVLSFDSAVQQGQLVSGALQALDIGAHRHFANVDEDAGVLNPTKSTAFTMFMYQMLMSNVEHAHIHAMGRALRRGDRQGQSPSWLAGRRLRFLSPDGVSKARAIYEELRLEYPNLPAQHDTMDVSESHFLSLEESARLLDWLRPALEEETYQAAKAALAGRRDG
jgi:hypothetical protein